MTSEDTGGGKLAELVAYHVLGNIHRDELVAVVYSYGLSYEVGGDHRGARPSLDGYFLVGLLSGNDTFLQFMEDVRTFL